MAQQERLVAAAIKRGGLVFHRGFQTHWQLRAAVEQDLQYTSQWNIVDADIEGFITSTGRFVDRKEAVEVAIRSKQIRPSWKDATRSLLSSDINW